MFVLKGAPDRTPVCLQWNLVFCTYPSQLSIGSAEEGEKLKSLFSNIFNHLTFRMDLEEEK